MKTFVTPLLTVLLSALLASCSLLPSSSTEQQSQLDRIQHFEVRGKISVRSPDDSVTGYLRWEQDHQQYDLFITGPLGQGSSRLYGDQSHASLTLPDQQESLTAASAEQLMAEQMGWYIPVQGIRYWIKGQPSPSSESQAEYDEYGMLASLRQDGWSITFKRYQQYQGSWLPGLIKLKGYDYQLTVAINDWTLYD